MVVRPQRGRVLPDDARLGHHVLLLAQGRRAPGLLVPPLDHSLLGPGLRLHLGRPAPPAQHRPARLGPDPRHALQPDALGAELGRHVERPAHAARRLGPAARRPGAQVLRRRRHLLRHGHLRGAAALDQERQRPRALYGLDRRPRARRRPRLERLHGRRHVLLDGTPPLRHEALLDAPREPALLPRHLRHLALRGLDVGQRRDPGPAVARGRRLGRAHLSELRRDAERDSAHVLDASGRRPRLPRAPPSTARPRSSSRSKCRGPSPRGPRSCSAAPS